MRVSFESAAERRNARIRLYKDDVFLIAQDAIRQQKPLLQIEELFATAEQFASFLLENDLSDREVMQYEIDDLRDEIPDEQSFYLVLTIAFVSICALRMTRANAERVARALVGFCQEYDEFSHLLWLLCKKEKKIEHKRARLLTYELQCIEKEGQTIDGLEAVASIVAVASDGLPPDSMLPVETVLAQVNDSFEGHPFQEELDKLRKARMEKSQPKIVIGEQHNENCQQFFDKIENPTFTTPR